MSEILAITADTVKIGGDDGLITELPLSVIQFPNALVGDRVRVYTNETASIITRAEPMNNPVYTAPNNVTTNNRTINKAVYVLVTFFLGGLGIHRFMRGQIGLGVLMLLFNWLTLGIWSLVDFIISLVKLSAYPEENYIFTFDGRFTR